jgi:hypothetical protein
MEQRYDDQVSIDSIISAGAEQPVPVRFLGLSNGLTVGTMIIVHISPRTLCSAYIGVNAVAAAGSVATGNLVLQSAPPKPEHRAGTAAGLSKRRANLGPSGERCNRAGHQEGAVNSVAATPEHSGVLPGVPAILRDVLRSC